MERSSKEHLLAASLQANIRAYTPDVGTGYFAIDLRSSCRIVLPAGRYSCWCDIHRLERGALKAENRGWIRAVLDPMPSSPPTLLQAPKTSTANLELALGATSTAATRSDFSVAPRLVNRGASATCSTKCQGGVVNVVAPVAASAVAMALVIISTRAADTSTAIDAVCSIVTFDADSGGVVSTSLFIARMPGAPVLFGRSSDVAVEQSWLLFSSAWIDRQLWPPPPHVQVKFEYGSADIRPSPWPSFLLRNHGAMGWVVCWKPPWPLHHRHDIRCVPSTALQEFLTCMMVLSVSIVACGLILKLAQRKCGGSFWCFLLEGNHLKDIDENSECLVLAGTCPDQASVYLASRYYMIMSAQLDDIDVVGLPVQNLVHQALFSDNTQLRPLPWPSFSTYAASVQLNAFLLSMAVHEFGINWGLLAEMRPICSMVLLLSIFGHSADVLALDGPATLVGILDWCRSPRCFLLLSSNWPVRKKRQLFGASVVLNLQGYNNMNMHTFELHSISMQHIQYDSVHFLPSALHSILASLKCGNHLKLAVLILVYKFYCNSMLLHQFTTTIQAPPVGVMRVLVEINYLAHGEFQFTSKIQQQLVSTIIQKMTGSSWNRLALMDLIDEGYCPDHVLITVPWQLLALVEFPADALYDVVDVDAYEDYEHEAKDIVLTESTMQHVGAPPEPPKDTGGIKMQQNKKQPVISQFLWDPGGSDLLHRLGGKPRLKKGGMSGMGRHMGLGPWPRRVLFGPGSLDVIYKSAGAATGEGIESFIRNRIPLPLVTVHLLPNYPSSVPRISLSDLPSSEIMYPAI